VGVVVIEESVLVVAGIDDVCKAVLELNFGDVPEVELVVALEVIVELEVTIKVVSVVKLGVVVEEELSVDVPIAGVPELEVAEIVVTAVIKVLELLKIVDPELAVEEPIVLVTVEESTSFVEVMVLKTDDVWTDVLEVENWLVGVFVDETIEPIVEVPGLDAVETDVVDPEVSVVFVVEVVEALSEVPEELEAADVVVEIPVVEVPELNVNWPVEEAILIVDPEV
jgi:hypothetical protein